MCFVELGPAQYRVERGEPVKYPTWGDHNAPQHAHIRYAVVVKNHHYNTKPQTFSICFLVFFLMYVIPVSAHMCI